MRLRTLRRALPSAGLFAALAAVSARAAVPALAATHGGGPLAGAARLPGLLWHDGGTRSAFLVRPRSVYDTEDGSGVIGVLHRDGATTEHGPGVGSLRWTRWTERRAHGVGTYWLKLTTPAAASPFTREPLTVNLFRVRAGHFTRMGLRYRQAGRPAHVTLCLSAPYRGSYTWDEIDHRRCT